MSASSNGTEINGSAGSVGSIESAGSNMSRSPDNFEPKFRNLKEIFKNLKKIGNGSYGTVFSASYINTNKRIALKLIGLKKTLDISSALQDMCLTKLFRSQYVVRVLETLIVEHKGKKYVCVVMEQCDEDLYAYIERNPGGSQRNLKMMFDMALGLRECTIRNILHGDIKTQNYLVKGDRVVMADFGLAQANVCSSSTLIQVVYTYPYRPPEVFFEVGYNLKADIWALGCVFYEFITGEYMFPGREFSVPNSIFSLRGDPENEFPEIAESEVEIPLPPKRNARNGRNGRNNRQKYIQLYAYSKKLRRKSDVKTWKQREILPEVNIASTLIENMTRINPVNRFNINQVLNHELFDQFRSSLYKDKLKCNRLTLRNYFKTSESQNMRRRNELIKNSFEIYYERTTDYRTDMIFYMMTLIDKIIENTELFESIDNPFLDVESIVISSAFLQGDFDPTSFLKKEKVNRNNFIISVINLLIRLKCQVDFSTPYNLMIIEMKKIKSKLSTGDYQILEDVVIFVLYMTVSTFSLDIFPIKQIIEFSKDIVNHKRIYRHRNKLIEVYEKTQQNIELYPIYQKLLEFAPVVTDLLGVDTVQEFFEKFM